MTDTFNLVPGTNEEKLLDNILRTAQGEQPKYNLAPNWRIEQYLDAIQKALSGGGGLPPVTESDAGKVLAVDNSGVWGAEELLPDVDVEDNNKVLTVKAKKHAVVAPLQIVTIEDGYEYTPISFIASEFVEGRNVLVIVDDHEYVTTVTNGTIFGVTGNYVSIGYKNVKIVSPTETNASTRMYGDEGEYSISMHVTETTELQAENVLPETHNSNNGAVLAIRDGVWTIAGVTRENNFDGYQIIPITYDGSDFATDITPNDIALGYNVGGSYYPKFIYSSFTKADIMGSGVPLLQIIGNADGVEFQSPIFPLDGMGMTGMIGVLMLSISGGADDPYTVTLIKWSAT